MRQVNSPTLGFPPAAMPRFIDEFVMGQIETDEALHRLPDLFRDVLAGISFVVVPILIVDMALVGVVLLALGVVAYVLYRRGKTLRLATPAQVAIPKPVTERARAGEYPSVLVAFDVRGFAPQTIATASKLAARRQRAIHVFVTITVPQALPINAELPEDELAARAVVEQARLQAGRRVTGHVERVRPGQSGRLIVEAARELQAVAIVMPLPPRTGTRLFGKTLRTVLADRPCRVVIECEPA